MVKRFLSMFAIASMMLATSCTNDEFDSIQTGNEATVSFTAQLPDGLQTKSNYGDGTTATTLSYAVYKVTNDVWTLCEDLGGDIDNFHITTTVSLRLVNGNTYAVVFWADAPRSIYTFDSENIKVTANYTDVRSNQEELDAFFAVATTEPGVTSYEVKLKRPFAQLNIGTADLEKAAAAEVNVGQAGIAVSAYTSFDFKTQNVLGDAVSVTFGPENLPSTDKPFPVEGYKYLTMNYLLMPADKQTVDVTLNCEGVKSQTFQNVPLQRNYRTNIYGNLLTHNEGFEVEIEPDFDGDYNSNGGGEYSSIPQIVDGYYEVANAEQFIWLTNNYQWQNTNGIKLVADIDFDGANVKPVIALNGTFDGQNHTMSNFAIGTSGSGTGLFSGDNIGTITIQNVTFKNVKAVHPNAADAHGYAGVVLGGVLQNSANVTLNNVIVDKAEVKGVQSVGGLVGLVSGTTTLSINNCQVINSNLSNYSMDGESGYVATLVGKYAGTVNITGNVVSKNNKVVGIYAGGTSRPENSIDEIAAHYNGGVLTGTASGENNKIIRVPYGSTIISTAAELVAFANEVNNNGNTYAGKTIVIVSDIDLKGYNWQPVGQTGVVDFCGVMEGNGYTIHNLTINHNATTSQHATGFFGWIDHAAVRDLNFENANVTGAHYVGVICGYNQFGEISNCKVTNSKVNAKYLNSEQDGDKCGGAIGMVGAGADTVKNITVTNTVVQAHRNAAQVIGYVEEQSLSKIINLSADNVTVEWNGDIDPNDDGKDGVNISHDKLYNKN